MNKAFFKHVLKDGFLILLFMEIGIFVVSELIPLLINLFSGNRITFNMFINNSNEMLSIMGPFIIFYILIMHDPQFKLGIQFSLSRKEIWKSQIISYVWLATFLTMISEIVNFGVYLPMKKTGLINSIYYNFYNGYFHNAIFNGILNVIVTFLLIITNAFFWTMFITFLGLFVRWFRKWLMAIGVVAIIMLIVGFSYLLVHFGLVLSIFGTMFSWICYALGISYKTADGSGMINFATSSTTNHITFSSVGNPIHLIITLLIINLIMLLLSRYFNDHIQIKNLLK